MRKFGRLLAFGAVLALIVGCGGGAATPTEDTDSNGGSATSVPVDSAEGCWALPPVVTGEDYVRGDPDAGVTIIEYADFQ